MALLHILVRGEIRFTRPTGGKSDSNDFRFERSDGQFIHPKLLGVNWFVFGAAVFRNRIRRACVYAASNSPNPGPQKAK
jgi:hypothetical protein